MQLSQRTFEAYYWHLLESPALYFSAKLTRLSNGGMCAFDLTTRPDPMLEYFHAVTQSIAIKNEAKALRKLDARPPLWLTLPVQGVTVLLWLMFLAFLCVGALGLGALCLIAEGACAIARGLRWVLC